MPRNAIIKSILEICAFRASFFASNEWLLPAFSVDRLDATEETFRFDPVQTLGLCMLNTHFMELCAVPEDERETFLQKKLANQSEENLRQYHNEFLNLLPDPYQAMISSMQQVGVSKLMKELIVKLAAPYLWSLQTTILVSSSGDTLSIKEKWEQIIANHTGSDDLTNMVRDL
ncbi:MAG TPA: hypothetical protein VI522_02035, partial [Gammaproteobacteria bacterium]|nr:hypothetical protein [Gammaproteobacteria bacterium]